MRATVQSPAVPLSALAAESAEIGRLWPNINLFLTFPQRLINFRCVRCSFVPPWRTNKDTTMTNTRSIIPLWLKIPPAVKEVLGTPALLSTEDPVRYWAMFARLAESTKPNGPLQWILLQTAHDEWWETQRARTLKALLIEEGHKRKTGQTAAEIELAHHMKSGSMKSAADPSSLFTAAFGRPRSAEGKQPDSKEGNQPHSKEGQQPDSKTRSAESKEHDKEAKEKLQQELHKLARDANAQLKALDRAPTNADFAAAVEFWIGHYERLEQVQIAAQRRFIAACEELERCRELDVVHGEVEQTTGLSSQTVQVAPPPPAAAPGAAAEISIWDLKPEYLPDYECRIEDYRPASVEVPPPAVRDAASHAESPLAVESNRPAPDRRDAAAPDSSVTAASSPAPAHALLAPELDLFPPPMPRSRSSGAVESPRQDRPVSPDERSGVIT
jgi:hypothetical protein